MRLLSIGAAPLFLLATLAMRAEGPVVDPGAVRISYEQQSWPDAGAAGSRDEHLKFGARILADWAVKSADDKRIVLGAKVREAFLECSRSRAPTENDLDMGDGCSATARSGELELILTRAGATLGSGLESLLRGAEIRQPGNSRTRSMPAFALEPFRLAITSAVFEAFSHLLTPTRVVSSEMRRIELQTRRGQPAGTFEISFPPPERWEAGELEWASGTGRFTPPRGKAVELPDRPVRMTWTHRGHRRDEWMARLEHPGSNPVPVNYDTRRRVAVEARFSAQWLGDGGDPPPEENLDRVRLAPGQRFLVEISTNEELRGTARNLASRSWHEATGILALAVAGGPGPQGGVRFHGLLLTGRLREAFVTGVSAARTHDPASLQTVPSLAGVAVEAEAGKDGIAVTVDDTTWRTVPGAAPTDPGRAAALRAALSRTVTACLQALLSDVAPGSPPVWSATIVDAEGKAAGEVTLAPDRKVEPKSNNYRLKGHRYERTTFPLAPAWRGRVAPVAARSGGSGPVLSRVADALLPVPTEAFLQASLEARDPKAPASAPISVTVWIDTRIKARQIGGPRHRPEPAAAAPAAPAAPPVDSAPPADTSPLPPPDLSADAPAAVRARVDALFEDLPPGWPGVETAIERYAELEAKAARSHAAAAAHAEIVLRLRDRVDRESLPALATRLEPVSPFAVRVLAMRLVVHAPGLEDAGKASTLARLLGDPDRYTVLLAGHFLGWVRHPESVEALIAALQKLEEKAPGKEEPIADRELRLSLAGDLYRLLGEGASRTAAAGFRDLWTRRGKTLPEDPFAPGTPTSVSMTRTYRTFSDVRSAPIVFLLDASSSMQEPVPAGGVPLPPGIKKPGAGTLEKLEWARGDLESILEDLEPGTRFQIISFNKTTRSLGGSLATVPKPSPGTKKALGPARAFLKSVKSQRGTNIHAALAKAFELPEAGAVCLLSDGHPTVGPREDEIDRDVFRWNYLRGARIVAASFTGDIAHPENLSSRLARRWFGWVRALDTGAVAEPDPAPAAEPPSLVDDDY